ncbi:MULTISPECIES: O-antigen ligase [Nostoc]|uniref:O-antigen ligase family protein n=1 Tax=Nostoc paludosum FACHB-159 TaxID=2692908 RepID=A0ABR8K230_9NOSO|nr:MULTISPECIES: O-antigen ligase family protein [Nostoc]MBD2678350.1 O-antigen ligase family protein [Nostoc sp. FACHB-857]MBD2733468.1 O-antigen ligase family protein [Nostoc paludosum FACHB-159]
MINIFFLLILFSSLLGRIKFPGLNIGIHYLLLPAFSFGIISLSLKDTKEFIKKNKIIVISVGILYVWMWVSSLTSQFPSTAITYSIKYSSYFILYFAFLVLTFRKLKTSSLTFYYRCILYLLQIIGVLGFLEALVPNHWIFELLKFPSFYPQIGSIMQNPNQFGVIMGIGLCLSLTLEKQNKISAIELYISEFIFLISLALSASRNAWLIFLFGLIILLGYKVIDFKRAIAIISLWLLCILTIPVSTYRIGLGDSKIFPLINLFSANPSEIVLPSPVGTALSRFALWKAAIIETIKRPLTGIGVGVFAEHIGTKVFGPKGFHAHNIFLNVLVEEGVPGLLIFINFLVIIGSKVKYANPVAIAPIMMFLASQLPDFFAEDYTFTTIEFYFLAAAINSRKLVPENSKAQSLTPLLSSEL